MGPYTYADLLRHDEAGDRPAELIEGELVQRASPRATHALSQARVIAALSRGEGAPDGGWWIMVDPDVRFADARVLRPDVAGWRRDRLPEVPDGAIDLEPDWVCEILSPGHVAKDRQAKAAIYATAGVRWYWLLDPDERFLEAHELREGRWLVVGVWQEGEVRVPPFEQVPLRVDLLFAPRAAEPPMAKEPTARYGPSR